MRRIRQSIGAPVGGVSRVPPSMRAKSEVQDSLNVIAHPLYGAYVRPPIQHVAQISTVASAQRASEHIAYDEAGTPYRLVVVNGTLNVYNESGVPQTISAPNGFGYLNGGDCRFVTIGLETYIVNRAVVPTTNTATTAGRTAFATFYVRKWEANKTYQVTVDGITASFTTGNTGSVITIANGLGNLLQTNLTLAGRQLNVVLFGTGFTVTRTGGTLDQLIPVSQQGPTEDSITILTPIVQIWEDLPLEANDGAIFDVVGNPDEQRDNYYMRFNAAGGLGSFGPGVWTETVAPNTPISLNAATWPHRFRRTPAGPNFGVFEQVPWLNRSVGDLITNPWPVVSGAPILDVFQIEGRLGLLGARGISMSETFVPDNLFRTATADVIPSDPVQVDAPALQGAWHSAVEWNGALLLWSDEGQSILTGTGQGISQATVALRQISAFRSDPTIKPLRDGSRVFFLLRTINGTEVWEYLARGDGVPPQAVNVTRRATQIITGEPRGMAIFEPLDLMLVATTTGLWAITVLEDDDLRRISPLGLPPGHSVMAMSRSELDLGLILNAPTGVSVNSINLERSS